MPPDMMLKDTHDIGMDLQYKLENLPEVERAFVHIDYQPREVDDHDPKIPVEYKTQLSRARPVQRLCERYRAFVEAYTCPHSSGRFA